MKEFQKSAIKAETLIKKEAFGDKAMKQVVYEFFGELLEPVGALKALKNIIITRLPNNGLYPIERGIISAQDLAKILNSEDKRWMRDAYELFSCMPNKKDLFLMFIIKIIVHSLNYLFPIVRTFMKVTTSKRGKSVIFETIRKQQNEQETQNLEKKKEAEPPKNEKNDEMEMLCREVREMRKMLEEMREENRKEKDKTRRLVEDMKKAIQTFEE